MASPDRAEHPRLTIALVEESTGWIFRLHREGRRVWADSYGTDAPVPVDYLAGQRTREIEAAAQDIGGDASFLALVSDVLRPGILPMPAAASEARRCDCP